MKLDPLSQLYKDMLDKLEKPVYRKTSTYLNAFMENGDRVSPLVTLHDGCGGVSHIIKDDGCFVLINRASSDGGLLGGNFFAYRYATHWFPEAVKALGDYLAPKPICFEDGFCDAAEYAKGSRPDATIQMAPETDASVAKAALRAIAKNDHSVSDADRIQAAATLLAFRDE
jgi:hypothetical protein